MKKKKIRKSICLTLTAMLVVGLCGCGQNTPKSEDLMENIMPESLAIESTNGNLESSSEASDSFSSTTPTSDKYDTAQEHLALAYFSVKLFQSSHNGAGNTLISPTSVLYALSLAANGAKGDTLVQMENTFGLPMDAMNPYLADYMRKLPCDENNKLHIANSIWLRDAERFTVSQDFLQINTDYYSAEVFKSSFDGNTVKEINCWINSNTDGMIPEILDSIPDDAIMYLVNAIAFDAKWQEPYEAYAVRDGVFTKEDGTTQNIELMYSTESAYLEDEAVTGFLKAYKEGKYAFVALLPKDGVTVSEYVASLDGEALYELLSSPQDLQVDAAIPKYKIEYGVEMNHILEAMGISDVFHSQKADLSGLGSSSAGNIFISRVLHKTFLSVDEEGTKAGAATVLEAVDECAPMEPEIIKTVHLDRPFVYMLIDCETNLPIFMGMVMSVDN